MLEGMKTDAVLVEVLQERKRKAHYQNLREELIQTAAVAVAMVESLDRNELVS